VSSPPLPLSPTPTQHPNFYLVTNGTIYGTPTQLFLQPPTKFSFFLSLLTTRRFSTPPPSFFSTSNVLSTSLLPHPVPTFSLIGSPQYFKNSKKIEKFKIQKIKKNDPGDVVRSRKIGKIRCMS
jgi:hypothetical protein